MDQNSALKKEAGIAERKLLARNERIQNLEALLQDADRRLAIQNQKFEAQLTAVKDRLDQARGKLFFFVISVSFSRPDAHFVSSQLKKLPPHRLSASVALRSHSGEVEVRPLPGVLRLSLVASRRTRFRGYRTKKGKSPPVHLRYFLDL